MTTQRVVSRRAALAGLAGLAASRTAAPAAPAARVAVGRCRSYDRSFETSLARAFDQLGGIGRLVKGKTVALKLNLTGNITRFPVKPDLPYRNDPDSVLALVHLLARAGARRVRLIESFFPARQELELWTRYGLDVAAINNAGCKVEWENTQNLGHGRQYVSMKVPGGGYVFPAYHLNHSFADCDVFASFSKLKNHWIAGVTMALKNSFGNTPCSLYGGDCGESGNEDPRQERGPVCHIGKTAPPKGVPRELHPDSPREAGYRVPRIVADLVAARPVDLSVVDGVDSIVGGEGEWNPGVKRIRPGLILAGFNPVCVDAVSMAVMGYDPRSDRGAPPFHRGDNTLKLAEAKGIGTTDLSRIEVVGLSIREAVHPYGPGAAGTRG